MLDVLTDTVTRFRDSRADNSVVSMLSWRGGGSQPSERVDSRLYSCEGCNVVYIDTDKQTCPHCGNGVEEVPATLDQ